MRKLKSSNNIGNKIKLYRQKACLTQEKLAETMGVTFQQIQNYESGKSKLNTDRLQQISDILNISPSHLLSEITEQTYLLSAQEIKLIDSYRAIKSDEKKECVGIFVEALRKKIK